MKNTKKALFMSLLSIVLCLSMLIGSTFAWFTDTATTGVNKIQAGTLQIDLVDATTGESVVGKTLDFKKATGAENETILWEPGCTYELPALKVENMGNLAFKYQVIITGIAGDAKLNEVIEWTIDYGYEEGESEGIMAGDSELSAPITIKGHMKEDAGNDYQGLTIDGISITVFATQVEAEYDSFDNNYDADAPTLFMIGETRYETLAEAIAKAKDGETIEFSGVITLPTDGTLKNRTLTFKAIEESISVIDMKDVSTDQSTSGANLTFDGVTVNWEKTEKYQGIQHIAKLTYKNCDINGLQYLHGETVFENCTLTNMNCWAVWTYGSKKVDFNKCTFITGGHAVLVYNELDSNDFVNNISFTDCTFNNAGTVAELWGHEDLVETSMVNPTNNTNKYNLSFTDCKVIGSNNQKLWGNKNNLTAAQLTVTIDGKVAERVEVENQATLNDAIVNAGSDKAVEVVLPAGTYTLPTVTGKDVTISGDKDTIVDLTNAVTASGSTVTMEGVTVTVEGDGTYKGIQHAEKVIYNNVTFNGTQFLYSDAEFNNCIFNVTGDKYNIWVYGNDAIFTDCTFNCDGKAVLQYNEGEVIATATFDNCTFNDDGDGAVSGKAAIEVGESAYGNKSTYTIKINNCTVTGFDTTTDKTTETNSGGNNLGTNVWGNKNQMPASNLHIVIDGKEVY